MGFVGAEAACLDSGFHCGASGTLNHRRLLLTLTFTEFTDELDAPRKGGSLENFPGDTCVPCLHPGVALWSHPRVGHVLLVRLRLRRFHDI